MLPGFLLAPLPNRLLAIKTGADLLESITYRIQISKSFASMFLQIEGVGGPLGFPGRALDLVIDWRDSFLPLSNDPASFGGRRG